MNLSSVPAQFARLWSALSRAQIVTITATILALASGLGWFVFWHKEQDFRPAFSGMAAEDAGAVVSKLKESGVEYRLSDNGSVVSVPSSRIAEVRLQMAAAGLPRTGRIGFELFDKTNLGTTDFAEQVNYRRALEGELERSIRSLSEVTQARVHLSFPKESVFTESKEAAKASVLLTLRTGAQLGEPNVRAIVNLVSSAVEGLHPESVSVADSTGRLLSRPKKTHTPGEASDELIEFRQMLERDLTAKANATLEPLLGAGKYRVGLSIDCDFTSGEQSDELYDPDKSVMVTTQKTEETTGTATSGGVPGTASNLPRPAPRSAGSSAGVTRRTENVTYQTSHTVRRTHLPQGTIRRISASVLLDQGVRWEVQNGKQNRILVPPTAESITAIKEVVSAAVGLVPTRGDQLVVQTLPFETTLGAEPPPLPPAAVAVPVRQDKGIRMQDLDWRIAAGAAAGVITLIAAVLGFLRARKKKKRKTMVQTAATLAAGSSTPANSALPGTAENRTVAEGDTAKLLAQAQERIVQTAHIESLVEELRGSIATDPALAASVLRTWLEEGQPTR